MDSLVIEYCQQPLQGTVQVSGAKNAVLPIMAAAILLKGKTKLINVPRLKDVSTMVALIEGTGSTVDYDPEGAAMTLDASGLTQTSVEYGLVKTMRASILLLGPLLTRFGHASVSLPGGCCIGSRPVDWHIEAMRALGASVDIVGGEIVAHAPDGLKGCEIKLSVPSVTATENIIMAAVLAEGKTTIINAAREPEVVDLVGFLRARGAKITGVGSSVIQITGVPGLREAPAYGIMPDRIEAGTYLVAAAMTRGCVTLTGVASGDLGATLALLEQAGARLQIESTTVTLDMQGQRPKSVSLQTEPYPGLPTDMQAQFLALNTIAQGRAVVEEQIFENRFMHVPELQRLGAKIKLSGQQAVVEGVPFLTAAPVMATDLRASASLVLAALMAKGRTQVSRIYHLDRGYEQLETKLGQLGACIHRAELLTETG